MRTRKDPEASQQERGGFDTDVDRYPSTAKALRRVLDEAALPDVPVEFVEIHALASGELTWRIRPPREDYTEGGYLAQAETS